MSKFEDNDSGTRVGLIKRHGASQAEIKKHIRSGKYNAASSVKQEGAVKLRRSLVEAADYKLMYSRVNMQQITALRIAQSEDSNEKEFH